MIYTYYGSSPVTPEACPAFRDSADEGLCRGRRRVRGAHLPFRGITSWRLPREIAGHVGRAAVLRADTTSLVADHLDDVGSHSPSGPHIGT